MRRFALAALTLAVAAPSLAKEAAPAPASPAAVAFAAPALVPQASGDRLAAFFAKTKGARTVFAADLQADLATHKYFIADVRPAADYAKGHIPGAVSLPLDALFTPASLAKLPSDKPILLVCHTGHTASMALGGLVALGYEPYVLRYSMLAWSAKTESPIVAKDRPQTVVGLDGPLEK